MSGHRGETPVTRGRWGQLTYTSFDRHDGTGGGWQVKDTTGGLDPEEQELLRARVQTQFDSGGSLPRFPTPAELEELPRRLVHGTAALRGSETGLWHHAPAGNDASGRPGNVFAHVVLDRNPDAIDSCRPIERWRSQGWLTPFGPEAVLAATLTSPEPPTPGPLNRDTIGSWLFAPRQWRLQTLVVLLDAVRAAFSGGPLVVLGAEDVDEAAHWIAAVSFAMSAGTARRFFFSTLERPATLAEAVDRGMHLACVPHTDLTALARRDGIVVIEHAGALELGDLDGEPHRTSRGDRIEVGEWSVLIQEVFADAPTLAHAVAEFDRIAHSIGDAGLDPAWPAAMLVAERPGAESRREAARVIAECAPAQLRSVPHLYATAVAGLRQQVGGRIDQAWRQVVKLAADKEQNAATVAGEVAVGVYAELALGDEPWLAQPGPARLPSTRYYTPVPDADLVRLAQLLVPHISPFSAELPSDLMLDEARGGLHFVELALRLGLAHDDELARGLWQVCQESLIPVLTDPALGGALVDSVDRTVARETRHWLWSQLAAAALVTGQPGERIAPAVLDTLGPGPDDPDPLAATWAWLSGLPDADKADVSPLIGELAWHRIREGETGPDARFLAVWSSVAACAENGSLAMLAPAARLLTPSLPLDRLVILQRRWPGLVPPEWLVPALAGAPLDDPLAGSLARGDAEHGGGAPATGFAHVRELIAAQDWLAAGTSSSAAAPAGLADRLLALGDGLTLAKRQGVAPDPELLRRVTGLVVLGLLAARSRVRGVSEPAALEQAAGLAQSAAAAFSAPATPVEAVAPLGTLAGFTADERPALVAWCDEVGVTSTALTELFLLADPRSMLRAPDDRVAGWLHAVGTGEPDSPPVTALVLAARLSRNAAVRDRTADEIMVALRTAPGSVDERAVRQTERFLQGWLRQAQTGRVRR